MEPRHFGVQVEEGDTTTSHRVAVSEGFVDDLNLTDVDPARVVEETFAFLLEREPATSILSEFSVDDVQRFFPDYPEELQARLRSG